MSWNSPPSGPCARRTNCCSNCARSWAPNARAIVIERLLNALNTHAARLAAAPNIWVALSGGADSTALLIALHCAGYTSQLRVTHINHGSQPAAKDWAEHCQALCDRLELPLDLKVAEPPVSKAFPNGFEAWAREVRYSHWQTLLAPSDLLVLGHHACDQQETVALRLLQKRLPLPIPQSRPLGAGDLLRPWLNLHPSDLREALQAINEPWIEDPSNQDEAMLRNQVRQSLLPALAPEWGRALQHCGALTDRLVRALTTNLPLAPNAKAAAGELFRLPLASTGPATLQAALQLCATPITRRQSTDLLDRLQTQAKRNPASKDHPGLPLTREPLHTPNTLSLWQDQHHLLAWRTPDFPPSEQTIQANQPTQLTLPHGTLHITTPQTVQVAIRAPQPGDTHHRNAHTHPIREALRHAGIPRWARPSYPLLVTPDHTKVLCIPRLSPDPQQTSNLQAHWQPISLTDG